MIFLFPDFVIASPKVTPSFSLLVKVHSAYFMNDMDLPSTIFWGSHVDMNPKNG